MILLSLISYPRAIILGAVQGVSELIKRIAFLRGLIPDPSEKHVEKTAEEELAAEILKTRGEQEMAEDFVKQAKDDR